MAAIVIKNFYKMNLLRMLSAGNLLERFFIRIENIIYRLIVTAYPEKFNLSQTDC